MRKLSSHPSKKLLDSGRSRILAGLAAALVLTGCGIQSATNSAVGPSPLAGLSGRVHGGQQPVSGATIQLYAASTGGYSAAASALIAANVVTDSNGNFSISGDYICPANSQVYITATGGNPGLSAGTYNNNLAMMAALGACSSLSSSTFININELTTVASVWPLARFMTGYANLGTSFGNSAGLQNAFAAVNKVVNIAGGTLPGTALPAGATLPSSEINTLANILAACVNSSGGVAGDQTACGKLFTAATPGAGSAPIDTIAAAVNIARNPSSNLDALFGLSTSVAPYQPSLLSTPTNFLIGINYVGGGLSTPKAIAVDAAGNVWLANFDNSSLTELNNTGTVLSPGGYTGGGLNGPSALAIDLSGNVWAANTGGSSVSKFSPAGTPVSTTGYIGGGLNAPTSISIDGSGNVWLANSGTNTVTELNSSGAALSPAGGYSGAGLNQPTAIAVNPN